MREVRTRSVRVARLVVGCCTVGLGVGLVLLARLGSDGYSTLVNGVRLALGVPYAETNWSLGLLLVALAWIRNVRPGVGTLMHPLIVGTIVDAVLMLGSPDVVVLRIMLLVAGAAVLAVGVALYLSAECGSGPFEALTLALRPLPFRTSYVVLQAGGTTIGWLLGAAIGPGTLLIVFAVGPVVGRLRPLLASGVSATTES